MPYRLLTRSIFSCISTTYTFSSTGNFAIYTVTKQDTSVDDLRFTEITIKQPGHRLPLRKGIKMGVSDMGDFQYQSIVNPSLLTNPDDSAGQGPFFNDMYPFGISEGDFADAPRADATLDFDDFDFNQQALQSVDGGFDIPTTPQSSLADQRYVSFLPQSQTLPSSVWRPLEQPVQPFNYPDPEIFSQSPIDPTPYYPLQPLPSDNTMTQHNFGAITPPGQQFSSIDHPLFLHGNMGPLPATAGMFQYEPISNYQDDGAFNPEDLSLSAVPEDLVATAIREGWALPGYITQQSAPHDDLFVPNTGNDNDSDISDAPDSDEEYKPSSFAIAKRSRRSRPSQNKAILPNGEVKKGRPCAKPQTTERMRINERRMEGYYRRKYDQGNLEKARQQSKESYWRRKQRRIAAGEKVRSYNALKRGTSSKKM
ncbi:hypothetical protein HO173_007040 [Letharia columbiana]|uniref:Uncharacterized protein n=1 Tax=Letharia columbiana TaxID=112416 RepID=A0A8H6FUA2_9LECA|nr:uncharacterized protein HO173_007040 [Letharia columbiana]KAF6234820.1 hypothetical protein HO173_007040 [Letharia columbiana]